MRLTVTSAAPWVRRKVSRQSVSGWPSKRSHIAARPIPATSMPSTEMSSSPTRIMPDPAAGVPATTSVTRFVPSLSTAIPMPTPHFPEPTPASLPAPNDPALLSSSPRDGPADAACVGLLVGEKSEDNPWRMPVHPSESRVTVTVRGCAAALEPPAPGKLHISDDMLRGAGCICNTTASPGSPERIDRISCPPAVGMPSTSRILSPALMPTLSAGPSASTRRTTGRPSSISYSKPRLIDRRHSPSSQVDSATARTKVANQRQAQTRANVACARWKGGGRQTR